MFENYRRYPRYSVSARVVVRRLDSLSPGGLDTQVTTISQGGMGFYTSVLMEKSTPVSVELLFHASDSAAREDVFEGKVASICAQGKDYYIGIAFDEDISDDRFAEIIG